VATLIGRLAAAATAAFDAVADAAGVLVSGLAVAFQPTDLRNRQQTTLLRSNGYCFDRGLPTHCGCLTPNSRALPSQPPPVLLLRRPRRPRQLSLPLPLTQLAALLGLVPLRLPQCAVPPLLCELVLLPPLPGLLPEGELLPPARPHWLGRWKQRHRLLPVQPVERPKQPTHTGTDHGGAHRIDELPRPSRLRTTPRALRVAVPMGRYYHYHYCYCCYCCYCC